MKRILERMDGIPRNYCRRMQSDNKRENRLAGGHSRTTGGKVLQESGDRDSALCE
jgi:hypothetical protein